MAHEKNHDYHILAPSPWPLLGAVGAFVMLFGGVMWMHDGGRWLSLGLPGDLPAVVREVNGQWQRQP